MKKDTASAIVIFKKSLSIRTGIRFNPGTSLNFSFSESISSNINGYSIDTRSTSRDYLAYGKHLSDGIPFSNWSLRIGGLEKIKLRFNLMAEENEEYFEAANNNDLIEVADALGDMLYILCGTIIEHGMQDKIEEVFDEIQKSNLSKLGENGKPIYREDGKVMKGPNYFKPDILKILN